MGYQGFRAIRRSQHYLAPEAPVAAVVEDIQPDDPDPSVHGC
jgi:hypothetical protein